MEGLKSQPVDVIFLDIQLPKISGIELLKSQKIKPQVILTTAFSEFALEGFELEVVDYLLKPFSFERFVKAINRLTPNIQNPPSSPAPLFVKTKGAIEKIAVDTILYLEAKGDFIQVHQAHRRVLANISLQDVQTKLASSFIRCHRSYIVNIQAIQKIIGNTIKLESAEIPIGRTYRQQLLEKLAGYIGDFNY